MSLSAVVFAIIRHALLTRAILSLILRLLTPKEDPSPTRPTEASGLVEEFSVTSAGS